MQLAEYTMLFCGHLVECLILIMQFSFCVLKQLCLSRSTIIVVGGASLKKLVIGPGHANRVEG